MEAFTGVLRTEEMPHSWIVPNDVAEFRAFWMATPVTTNARIHDANVIPHLIEGASVATTEKTLTAVVAKKAHNAELATPNTFALRVFERDSHFFHTDYATRKILFFPRASKAYLQSYSYCKRICTRDESSLEHTVGAIIITAPANFRVQIVLLFTAEMATAATYVTAVRTQ